MAEYATNKILSKNYTDNFKSTTIRIKKKVWYNEKQNTMIVITKVFKTLLTYDI